MSTFVYHLNKYADTKILIYYHRDDDSAIY